jgi:hypothetical protein
MQAAYIFYGKEIKEAMSIILGTHFGKWPLGS